MRRYPLGLFVFICLVFLGGCVSTGEAPAEVRYTLHRDLSYGSHERHRVDISVPRGTVRGVILFIHGGIWMAGGKENCPVFLDVFRDRFMVAAMNHRYIDETTRFSDLEDDVAAAVAYIRDFSREKAGDPGKLIIMGHSSGAHLAMTYAYKHQETSPIPLAFCVNMAGPADLGDIAFFYNFKKLRLVRLFYDLAEKGAGYRIVAGDITGEGYNEPGRRLLASLSPISYVTAGSPPTITVHDVADKMVPYSNSTALNSLFNAYGLDHTFIATYSGIGHFLGAKATRTGAVHYDRDLETWLIRVMNEYMEKYCGAPPPEAAGGDGGGF